MPKSWREGSGLVARGSGGWNGIGNLGGEGEVEDLERKLQWWVMVRGREDTWEWVGGGDVFSVKVLRRKLEDRGVGGEVTGGETGWCTLIPRKVNIFIWRDEGGYQREMRLTTGGSI